MPNEQQAGAALVLLVAVCEQAMLELAALDPPADTDLVQTVERTRDLATVELRFGRFSRAD
jgi:hypothetical protein